MRSRNVLLPAMALAMLTLTGCQLFRQGGDDGKKDALAPRGPLPTYRQVVERYNRQIAGLDRIWSRVAVELRWIEDGRKRFEQGEGNFIVVMPDHLALSVGKLGNTLLWVGADSDRYWLFDLQENKEAYVGRHENVGKPGVRQLGLPVHPLALVLLLGVTPLDPSQEPSAPQVEWYEGQYLIEPLALPIRMLIDPRTGLPSRVDLLDVTGRSIAMARLSDPQRVALAGSPPGAWPHVATRVEVALADQQGSMTLHLSALSDGRDSHRIDDRAFDFEHLVKVLKPARVIDLDEKLK